MPANRYGVVSSGPASTDNDQEKTRKCIPLIIKLINNDNLPVNKILTESELNTLNEFTFKTIKLSDQRLTEEDKEHLMIFLYVFFKSSSDDATSLASLANQLSSQSLVNIIGSVRKPKSNFSSVLQVCVFDKQFPRDRKESSWAHLLPPIMNLPPYFQAQIFRRYILSGGVGLGAYSIDDTARNQCLHEGEFGVAHFLYQLKTKANALQSRQKTAAYNAANTLHTELSGLFLRYLNKEITLEDFKTQWRSTVDTARTELIKLPNWENFLANLALIIVTLGVIHIGTLVGEKLTGNKCSITDQYGFFSLVKADALENVEDLEHIVDTFSPINQV